MERNKMMRMIGALVLALFFGPALMAADRVDESKLWQARIDAASAKGGGTVVVPKGVHWVPKGLTLKDNVTLRVDRGATLLGSTNGFEYIVGALVNAQNAVNVAIEGEGTLDAQGDKWERRTFDKNGKFAGWRNPDRAFNVCYFKNCCNVRLEGVFLTNPSSWTCFFNDCDGVIVRKLRIWSHVNTSNDGLDIASRNVLVEDCDIDSEDDALVFKTPTAFHRIENVEVRRCRLSSNSGICKFGTETLGTTRHVRIHDCEMSVRTPIKFRGAHHWFPGQRNKPEETTFCAIDAIELAVMDGGCLEDVEIRNIKMGFGILAPIVIRHGDRKKRVGEGKPYLRNVLLENIEMTLPARGHIPCQITGVPGFRPKGITLRNVKLTLRGGVKAADVKSPVPERPNGYPGPCVYGSDQFLPAWGLYIRHADGIRLENVKLALDDASPGKFDERAAVWIEDADVQLVNCDIDANPVDPTIEKVHRISGAVEYRPQNEAELKACLAKLNPGDEVSLVPGRVYRTGLVIRRSGTAAKPIVIHGNGAVMEGLAPIPDGAWQSKGGGLFFFPNGVSRGANRPRVVDREGRFMKVVNLDPNKVKPETLKPGEANWDRTGAWYRVKDGEKSPAGLGLQGCFGDCGVDICNQSYITIENLTARHFSNDGFNVHGQSQGLVFRNICGCDCGDDGFSVHEDVEAVVYNGHFFGCDDGIQDIQASQTSFFGCLVESNRLWGVGFSGGLRGLYDTVIRNNAGDQLWVGSSHIEKPFKFAASVPLIRGVAYFKNLTVEGGRGNAIRIDPGSEVSCDNCRFARTVTGAEVRKNATLHLSRCRFENLDGASYKVDPSATLVVDGVRVD